MQFENFVFEGGGVLGYAYVGVAQALESRKIVGKQFAGSSAGSMAAGLFACRATAAQVKQILESLDMNEMFDSSYFPFYNAYRLYYEGGWAKGEKLRQWYGDILESLCDGNRNITFREIYERFGTKLVITGTLLEKKKTLYYTTDLTPEMSLLDAVDISTRYPAAYPMVQTKDGSCWDGGIGDNFPMHVFDRHISNCPHTQTELPEKHCKTRIPNPKTLGFKLVKQRPACCPEHDEKPGTDFCRVDNVISALKLVASMVLDLSQRLHVHERDWKRTVRINVGELTALDFDLTEAQKQMLVDNAYRATIDHLDAAQKSTETVLLKNEQKTNLN